MKLYEKIYTLRTEKNLSQGDLAELLDVSRQSVSKWETGASIPDLDKLVKMKEIFGVSIDELVCEDIVEKKKEEVFVSTEKNEVSPQIVVVKESIQMRKFVGILMFFGAFFMLLFSGYDLAVYLTVMGILCLVCKKRSWLWCLWFSFFVLGQGEFLSVFEAFHFRWYDYYIERGQFWKHFGPAWLYFIGFVVLIVMTVWSFRRYRLSLTRSRSIILGIGWAVTLSMTPILRAIFSHILKQKMKTWILNPEDVAAGASPVYSGELHQEWAKFENLFFDIYEVFFVSAFCALTVLTFALIRTHLAKKKESVPNETT